MNAPYVDIHTHALTHDPRIVEVQSLDCRIPVELSVPNGVFTFGLHPWHVDDIEEAAFFSGLKSSLQNPGFFGLGEIGLDRARSDNWDKQLEVFKKQLDFAQKFRLDRIVIHCVRAYFDILPELQKLKIRPRVILHDFNANLDTAKKFMDSLDCYFSFGAKLFKADTKAAKTFQALPEDRIFLETDDQLDHSILKIYEQAVLIKNTSLERLKERLFSNFQTVYPEYPLEDA